MTTQDASGFFDDFALTKKNSQVKKTLKTQVIFEDSDPQLNVLIADWYTERQLFYVKELFHRDGKLTGAVYTKPVRIRLIYIFPFVAEEKHMVKNLWAYFYENIKPEVLRGYLVKGKPTVSIGRALYAATFDTNLQPSSFYESVFNKTYFYSPFIRGWVYPIDAVTKWTGFGKSGERGDDSDRKFYLDCFSTFHAAEQIRRALDPPPLPRASELICEEVDPAQYLEKLNREHRGCWAAVDCETSSLERTGCRIGCVTISIDGLYGAYLEWSRVPLPLFREFLSSHRIICANAVFDILVFAFHGADLVKVSWDTMIAGHFLNENRSNGLKSHAFYYTPHGGYDLPLEVYKMRYPGLHDYTAIPKPVKLPYACKDAIITFQVFQEQLREMNADPELYNNWIRDGLPILNVFIRLQYNGLYVDWDRVRQVGKDIKDHIALALKHVQEAFHDPTITEKMLNSKEQLGAYLEKLGWERLESTKKGGLKVGKSVMHEWEKQGHLEVRSLREFQKWVTVLSVFVGEDGAGEEIGLDAQTESDFADFFSGEESKGATSTYGLWKYRASDDKVHGWFAPMMANTHRHRSYNPNMQNQSKRDGETAKVVRSCFTVPDVIRVSPSEADKWLVYDKEAGVSWSTVAPAPSNSQRVEYYKQVPREDWCIGEIDSSNLQARIVASRSGNKQMCSMFKSGMDFHSYNTFNIVAKHYLFNKYTIVLDDRTTKVAMEWEKPVGDKYASELQAGELGIKSISKEGVTIDLETFFKNAKKGVLKAQRNNGKAIGLGCLFGMSVSVFAEGTLQVSWTPKACRELIADLGLRTKYEKLCRSMLARQYGENYTDDLLNYYVVAAYLREGFFKLYDGLEDWEKEQGYLGARQGYVRSSFGARRLVPELRYQGKDSNSRDVKNQQNICVNSPVQEFETVVIGRAMDGVQKAMDDYRLQSHWVGNIHDATIPYIYLPELDLMSHLLLYYFQKDYPENKGIPYFGELNVAYYSKGEVWGFGRQERLWDEVKDVAPPRKQLPTR